MPVTEAAMQAVQTILSWPMIGWLFLGLLAGIVFGALPGIGAPVAMAITLPLTAPIDGTAAIILLVSVYLGAEYGGSISAILINVPGTPGAAATTFDGYPMAKQGKAINALVISSTSSSIGGIVSAVMLFLISPLLVQFVLMFGSPEYFLMAVLGIALITVVTRGSMVKGFVAGAFGMFFSTIGMAPSKPELRYTFGVLDLNDGLHYVAALIGLFAVAEMYILANQEGGIAQTAIDMTGSVRSGIVSTLRHPIVVAKSGFIGMAVGAIPGAGASVSNFISYAEEMRSGKADTYGRGEERGVMASEASNSATVGGSLIPTLSFGIPGSGSSAILLGGLIMHGLIPGVQMFDEQLHVTFSMYFALAAGSLLIFLLGAMFTSRTGYLTKIDTNLIVPIVIVLSILGGFMLRRNWFDVLAVFAMGGIGFYMKRYNYSVIAFVLGAILGPIAEANLHRSLQLSHGSPMIFVTKPLSAILVVLIAVIVVGPFLRSWVRG